MAVPDRTLLNLLLLASFILAGTLCPAQGPMSIDGVLYPVPKDPHMLFYLQRSTNENTVVYALHVDERGKPVLDDPVRVFWRRYQEDGEKRELDFIQRTFAYGVKVKDLGDRYELRCVAYSALPLYCPKTPSGQPMEQVRTTVNGREMILNRIHLRIEGGTFWFPNVTRIEFTGTDPLTGRTVVEGIKP